jgi:hypothetical protein
MYTDSDIWVNQDFRNLREDAKLLFLYLLSSPHSNCAGFYKLPILYCMADLGWDESRVIAAMSELSLSRDSAQAPTCFIAYDARCEVVYIPTFLRYNPIKTKNHVRSALGKVAAVPDSPLKVAIITRLNAIMDRLTGRRNNENHGIDLENAKKKSGHRRAKEIA